MSRLVRMYGEEVVGTLGEGHDVFAHVKRLWNSQQPSHRELCAVYAATTESIKQAGGELLSRYLMFSNHNLLAWTCRARVSVLASIHPLTQLHTHSYVLSVCLSVYLYDRRTDSTVVLGCADVRA